MAMFYRRTLSRYTNPSFLTQISLKNLSITSDSTKNTSNQPNLFEIISKTKKLGFSRNTNPSLTQISLKNLSTTSDQPNIFKIISKTKKLGFSRNTNPVLTQISLKNLSTTSDQPNLFKIISKPPKLGFSRYTNPFLTQISIKNLSTTSDSNKNTSDSNKNTSDQTKIFKIISKTPKLGLETVLNQSGIRASNKLVEDVLHHFKNAGLISLHFFRWAEKQKNFSHTLISYHTLLESLSKIQQYKLMWDLLQEMKNKHMITIQSFCIIMKMYSRAHKIQETIYTFNLIEQYGLTPNLTSFNSLLSSLCKSNNTPKAHNLFQTMKHRFVPDTKTYTILLEGWGRASDLPKARMVFSEMAAKGCPPDIVTYGIMVDILCKSGRVDDAISLVKDMRRGGHTPTSLIYGVIARAYGARDRVDDAVRVFSEMERDGVEMDVVAYNALIGVFCRGGRFREVFMVLEEMTGRGVRPNSRTCNVVLTGLIAGREWRGCEEMFRRMARVCEPDADTYTIMIKMFCKRKEVEKAAEMWTYMKSRRFVPSMHTFSVLINGLCETGEVVRASELFEEMMENGIRPCGVTVGRLREALLKEGKKDEFEILKGKMNMLATHHLF